ncbi:class I SAM-dependent methyltransferase [Heyndrickxia acidicola]|jgi:SAM-dependent methyltransferase|uniref:Methyltransferase n=1 Tax=Heyndrickxia acidicola TaxID=209389 RepID=A0ABU6MCS8_9BACI|nr:methyltransferase [Heyndrickxia acidicola]MED1202207.1 methyltransferase [Heyndrickxia acidicola]
MNDQYYDALLNVKTGGEQKGFNQSLHYHRYEATSYSALETLFNQYELKSDDQIVDFGCGKGRLNFYANYLFGVKAIGVEMNEKYYAQALRNLTDYAKRNKSSADKINFYCCLAEKYKVSPLDNRFYFFNPFSIQIFMKVVKNILRSLEENKRDIEVILYYGSSDYIFFLENHPLFNLKQHVPLPGLFEHNSNEAFFIYKLSY